MREICLDTETTGLDPRNGDRVVEIACIEMVDKVRTGRFYHQYINPRRDMPQAAFAVHGLSSEFLETKPIFDHIAQDFLDFIQGATLVIHNASFDIKFLNAELGMMGLPMLDKSSVIDTLSLARKKFPGSPASLDALCKRFGIDLSRRSKHGALLDTELLCDVFVELMGGAQEGMAFANKDGDVNDDEGLILQDRKTIEKRNFIVSDADLEAHKKFITDNFKNNSWYS